METNLDTAPLLTRTNDRSIADGNVQLNTMWSIEEQEKSIPEFSTYFGTLRKWYSTFRYPIAVIVANIVSNILVLVLFHGPTEYIMNGRGYYHYDASTNFLLKGALSAGLALYFFTAAYNANACWTGAKNLEKQINVDRDGNSNDRSTATVGVEEGGEQQHRSEGEGTGRVDLKKLSLAIDSAFGYNQGSRWAPQATFFVCFLYALSALSFWQVVQGGADLLLLHVAVPNRDLLSKGSCFFNAPFEMSVFDEGFIDNDDENEDSLDIASLETLPIFKDLPIPIQEWCRKLRDTWDLSDSDFNRSLPYVPMVDGSIAFVKAGVNAHHRSFYDGDSEGNMPGVLVYSPQYSNATEYTPTREPSKANRISMSMETHNVMLVGFPSAPPHHAWCALFQQPYAMGLLEDEMVCNNVHTKQFERFPTVIDKNVNGRGNDDSTLCASNEKLWIAKAHTLYKRERKIGRVRMKRVSIVAYDVSKMEKEIIFIKNATKIDTGAVDQRSSITFSNPKCYAFDWIRTVISIVALTLLTSHLYKLDIPACSVPACFIVVMVTDALFYPNAGGLVLLALAGGCLYFLTTTTTTQSSALSKVLRRGKLYLSNEIVMWALYALQVGATWHIFRQMMNPNYWDDFLLFEHYFSLPILSLLFTVATSILLNHPILQILAVSFSTLGFLSFFFVFAGLSYLMVPAFLLSLALGCFRAGSLLQIYRVHIIVGVRRMCCSCKNSICRPLSAARQRTN